MTKTKFRNLQRLLLIIVLCGTAGHASTAAAFSTEDKAQILYVGDSLAANTLNSVRFWLQATDHADVLSDGAIFPGTALCDFLEGQPTTPNGRAVETLRTLVQRARPDLIVLQFWGNRATPCMTAPASDDYYAKYARDAESAVSEIETAARDIGLPRPRILWVLQGPDSADRERPRRLNDTYAATAARHGDRTTDAGWTVSMAAYPYDNQAHDRYQWTQFLPCNDWERATNDSLHLCTQPEAYGGVTQLHRDDDPIHFCLGEAYLFFNCDAPSPAIDRYGMRIANDSSTWLGL
jgi:hypothetical protein